MKAVLISIKPKYVEKIASGEKTIKVCKTRPKLETPFKCYIYCTQDFKFNDFKYSLNFVEAYKRSGKVIGEFVCGEITEFGNNFFLPSMLWIEKEACLSGEEICKYLGEKESGFAWHITDLKIYDEPKELREFNHYKKTSSLCDNKCGICDCISCNRAIKRPPQSWQYVEDLGE